MNLLSQQQASAHAGHSLWNTFPFRLICQLPLTLQFLTQVLLPLWKLHCPVPSPACVTCPSTHVSSTTVAQVPQHLPWRAQSCQLLSMWLLSQPHCNSASSGGSQPCRKRKTSVSPLCLLCLSPRFLTTPVHLYDKYEMMSFVYYSSALAKSEVELYLQNENRTQKFHSTF